MLNAICFQISLVLNTRCRVSNRTLHNMGYIITSNPIAVSALTFFLFRPKLVIDKTKLTDRY
jgi:hypothetical protein